MHLSRNSYQKPIERLKFSESLARTAAEIPDGIAKLRFLRGSVERRNHRARRWKMGGACACIALIAFLAAAMPRSSVIQSKVFPGKKSASETGSGKTKLAAPVWLVEENQKGSVYSNGLHVWNDFRISGPARQFRPLARASLEPGEIRTKPVGIVYHTSESLMAPFDPHGNESLRRYGLRLLGSVMRSRLYNFVIDRFGRVFRVVPEMQIANHAGHSVWADRDFVYVNLNGSFIGVSFEAQTPGSAASAQIPVSAPISDAQAHSGQILTQMLRGVYNIPEEDCVTHAQVSVNPSNMYIGYHTDWASHFPFREMGLPDGYESPVAGIDVFGFRYDSTFLQAIGGMPWKGIVSAEERLIRSAAAHGATPDAYRKTLQKKYIDTVGGLSGLAAAEEKRHEQS